MIVRPLFARACAVVILSLVPNLRAQSTLTIALSANINTLDPQMSGSVGSDLSVSSHLYSSLLTRGADLKLHPSIASSWRALDNNTWEFHLRAGIRFPDGEPLDAATVAWNIARVQNPHMNARIRPWFTSIKQVQVLSPTLLRIVTTAPFPALPEQLSMLFLMAPQWTSQHKPAISAMGTGPYDIAVFAVGDRIELRAKAHYWGIQPSFDRVVFRILTDPESRVSALLAGEVDFIRNIPVEDFARIRSSHRAYAGAGSSARGMIVKFNTLTPPFKNNRNLRLALNYAVDKQAILDTILSGAGSVLNCQMLTPEYFGYNLSLRPIPYNPEKARQLFRLSGVPKGTIIDLDVPINVYYASDEITQAVAGQIEEVLGIGIRIHEMDFSIYMNKYVKAQSMAPMQYITQAWPTLDADGLLTLFAPGNPYSYWDDKQFGDLLLQGRSSMDVSTRRLAYQRATQRMCDEAPGIFLLTEPLTYAVSNRVSWTVRNDDWIQASDFAPAASTRTRGKR
ncbi:ABC transporter substrate-binding protein [Telmatobacter bradus]|uniref:ABC transporter substrate-binding protein n=1 Tax=Telmatobacter bradus TaxID=474953 RepID=UPI003B43B1E9